MNLAEIMSSSWYEDGRGVGIKLVMNTVDISAIRLFMAVDHVHGDGYRFSLSSER